MFWATSGYPPRVRWEALFDDLEAQLDAEWAAERRRDAEEDERLRVARLTVRDRLAALCADAAEVTVHTLAGPRTGTVTLVAGDAVVITGANDEVASVIPLDAVAAVTLPAGPAAVRRSLLAVPDDTLTARIGFGYLMRQVARRRAVVRVHTLGGGIITGTIDRAGADHLDIADHDPDDARRDENVRAVRLVPIGHVVSVDVASVEPRR